MYFIDIDIIYIYIIVLEKINIEKGNIFIVRYEPTFKE